MGMSECGIPFARKENVIDIDMEELIHFVVESINDHLDCPYVNSETVECDTDLSSIGLDSFAIIRLIVEIEDAYNVEFSDSELLMENVATVGRIHKCLRGHLS